MHALTDFGDTAVLLPLSVMFFLWLMLARSRAAGLWWLAVLAGCGALTVALKVYFYACPPFAGLQSPSGHSAFSVLAYGALALIVAAELRSQLWQAAVAAACSAFVMAIAVSRVILRQHTIWEIAAGLLIGSISFGVYGLVYLRRKYTAQHGALMPLLVGSAITIALFHGSNLNVEHLLQMFSRRSHLRAVCRPDPGEHLRALLTGRPL